MEIWQIALMVGVAVVAFGLGWLLSKGQKHSPMISFKNYTCLGRRLVVTVENAPDGILAYGMDANGPQPEPIQPPAESAFAPGAEGDVTINNVPHQNNSQQIKIVVWSIIRHGQISDVISCT